jgi:hypothetical protein
MEPEGSFPRLQQPTILPYSFEIHFNIILQFKPVSFPYVQK